MAGEPAPKLLTLGVSQRMPGARMYSDTWQYMEGSKDVESISVGAGWAVVALTNGAEIQVPRERILWVMAVPTPEATP